MMLLRVLGPLEAETDGQPTELGSRLQRAVLALLLTERGHAVSVDRMIDQLWQGEAPPRAIASLQSYISNLRRLPEPDRPQRSPATILVSAPPGYAIRLPAEAVDAWPAASRAVPPRTWPARASRNCDSSPLTR